MSPTVFRVGELRFFFFSREETPVHVHVLGPAGEAKISIEPEIAVARNAGLPRRVLRRAVDVTASIEALADIERPHDGHLRWPQLDVDLTLDAIEHPDRYPLVSREEPSKVADDG